MNLYIIASQGIEVPQDRIDYIRWHVEPKISHKINVELVAGDVKLTLHTERSLSFSRVIYFNVASLDPATDQQHVYDMHSAQAPFLDSSVYTEMSETSQERVNSIKETLDKYTQRLMTVHNQLASLDNAWTSTKADVPSVEELRKREKICRSKITSGLAAMESLSKHLTETTAYVAMTIPQLMESDLWDDQVDGFYHALLNSNEEALQRYSREVEDEAESDADFHDEDGDEGSEETDENSDNEGFVGSEQPGDENVDLTSNDDDLEEGESVGEAIEKIRLATQNNVTAFDPADFRH